jgi:3-methylcrotonyl-CoA carboxylase beta subunit
VNLLPITCCCYYLNPAGVTDHFAQDEPHALAITRNIFANLNLRNVHNSSSSTTSITNSSSTSSRPAYDPNWEEPLYDPEELHGAVPSDSKAPWDVRGVLARILDGSRFEEFKSNYGKTLVTGVCIVVVRIS